MAHNMKGFVFFCLFYIYYIIYININITVFQTGVIDLPEKKETTKKRRHLHSLKLSISMREWKMYLSNCLDCQFYFKCCKRRLGSRFSSLVGPFPSWAEAIPSRFTLQFPTRDLKIYVLVFSPGTRAPAKLAHFLIEKSSRNMEQSPQSYSGYISRLPTSFESVCAPFKPDASYVNEKESGWTPLVAQKKKKKKGNPVCWRLLSALTSRALEFFLFFQSRWTSASNPPPPPFPDHTNTCPAAPRPSDADEKRVSERRRRAKPAAAPYYPLNGGGLITVTMTDGLLLDRWDETRGEETKNMQGRIYKTKHVSACKAAFSCWTST